MYGLSSRLKLGWLFLALRPIGCKEQMLPSLSLECYFYQPAVTFGLNLVTMRLWPVTMPGIVLPPKMKTLPAVEIVTAGNIVSKLTFLAKESLLERLPEKQGFGRGLFSLLCQNVVFLNCFITPVVSREIGCIEQREKSVGQAAFPLLISGSIPHIITLRITEG